MASEIRPPGTARIEAFSDGVIAIVITVMVLELKLPDNVYMTHSLLGIVKLATPKVLVYMLSFVVVAILLVNHHALMREAPHASSALYWWNAHLLFWISLIPFSTATMGTNPFEPSAVGFYGAILGLTAFAFTLLHRHVSRAGQRRGRASLRTRSVIFKDVLSTALYIAAIPLAYVSIYISDAIYVAISAAYFLPDFELN
jgi:uncharacterized membrane protein